MNHLKFAPLFLLALVWASDGKEVFLRGRQDVATIARSSNIDNNERSSSFPFVLPRRLAGAVCGDGSCNKGENCIAGDAKCCESDCGCATDACDGGSAPPPPPTSPPPPPPPPPAPSTNCPAGSTTCTCLSDSGTSCDVDSDCDVTTTTTTPATCTKGGTVHEFQCSSSNDCKSRYGGGGWTCNAESSIETVTPASVGDCAAGGSSSPTQNPTAAPVTPGPSSQPTESPVTPGPTESPTTRSPITPGPTGSPVIGPITPVPTRAPTKSPAGPTNAFPVSSAADIIAAMATAQPGDVLLMSTSSAWTDQEIEFVGDGTPENPITLTSDTPGTPVLLNGASRLRLSGSHLVVDGLRFDGGALTTEKQQVIEFRTSSSNLATNCRVTNTAIVDYNPPQSTFDYRWVGIYGTYNRVDHCYFSGKNNQGPLMIVWRRLDNTPDFHRIDHNYFGNFASGGGLNGWETIRIGTSAQSHSDSSSEVSSNLFERCNGEIEIISVKSGNNVLRGNTFDSCEGMLTLRHGRGNSVDGNFFFGRDAPDSGGVRIIDADHAVTNNYFEGLNGMSSRAAIVLANGLPESNLDEYFPVERATVAFNTVYNCKEAIRIGWRSSSNTVAVKDSVIANNAVFSTSGNTIIHEEDAPTNMLYEGNLMYGDGVTLGLSPVPPGIVETDPVLILGANDLYRPNEAASSPCIDGAVGEYPSVVADMDGEARPSAGSSKDVGADEVVSGGGGGQANSGPLSNGDVGGTIGPVWYDSTLFE